MGVPLNLHKLTLKMKYQHKSITFVHIKYELKESSSYHIGC